MPPLLPFFRWQTSLANKKNRPPLGGWHPSFEGAAPIDFF